MVESNRLTEPGVEMRIYNGLTRCELQKTYNEGKPLKDKVWNLLRAQHYANKTLEISDQSSQFQEDGRSYSALESVKTRCAELRVGFLVGLPAE